MANFTTELGIADLVIIIVYFVVVIAIGIWSAIANRGGTRSYFLASRKMHWIPIGASLFVSNIGSGHFIGLAGAGAANGLGSSAFELNATLLMPLLGWIFLPIYLSSSVVTMPEYLGRRFGGQRIRVYYSVLSLILYVFSKIAVDLYAGTLFIEQTVRGLESHWALSILLLVAAVSTIFGGLTAVIWTDLTQTVIMLVGAFWLMIASFVEIGGYEELRTRFPYAIPGIGNATWNTSLDSLSIVNVSSCAIPSPLAYHLAKPLNDPDLPFLGVTAGWFTIAIWYWCADQVIVQRALAAKNLTHARAGCVLCGYLKLLPMWLIVFPGMIARVLYTDEVACVEPDVCEAVCGNRKGCKDIAYTKLILNLMPPAAKGLMLAALLSSLITSLTSVFNSASSIFTNDIWSKLRRRASETEKLIVGRIAVLVIVGISLIWLPILKLRTSLLFNYTQASICYFGPPVSAVYLMAVFWKRVNEVAAFWSLMIGLVVGLSRFIWEFCYPSYSCMEIDLDYKPAILKDVHYMHFAIILFLITTVVCALISLSSEPIDERYLRRLLFSNRFSQEPAEQLEMIHKRGTSTRYNEADADRDSQDGNFAWRMLTRCCAAGMRKEHSLIGLEGGLNENSVIEEDPRWKRTVNTGATLMIVSGLFVWFYFN